MLVILIFPALYLSGLVEAAMTSYDQSGRAKTNENGGWTSNDYSANVCNSTADVSSCCSTVDVCLSNGLCLRTGNDDYLSKQGCTDPNWPEPCQRPCGTETDVAVCAPLIKQNGQITYYCLSDSNGTNDCASIDSRYRFTIPVGTLQIRPYEVPASLINNVTKTVTTRTTSTYISTPPPHPAGHEDQILGLGLSISLIIPPLAALAAAVRALLRRTRELKQLRTEKNSLWRHAHDNTALQPWSERVKYSGPPQEVDGNRDRQELG